MTIHTPDEVADIADQMAFVADGRVVASGPPADIMRDAWARSAATIATGIAESAAGRSTEPCRVPRGVTSYIPLAVHDLSVSVVGQPPPAPEFTGAEASRSHMTETPAHPLTPLGGEFRAPDREAAFQAERLADTLRHVRMLFLLSAVLNSLFLLSDWRFYGDPHFYVAIPARVAVVIVSLALFLGRPTASRPFESAQRIDAGLGIRSRRSGWPSGQLPQQSGAVRRSVLAVDFLSGRSDLVSLDGDCRHDLQHPAARRLPPAQSQTSPTDTGLVLAMVTLNLALLLVVTRSNRLQRTEWAATQAERMAKEELIASRAMFETMFKTVPIPLVVTRLDGTLVTTNDASIRFFGVDPEDDAHPVDQRGLCESRGPKHHARDARTRWARGGFRDDGARGRRHRSSGPDRQQHARYPAARTTSCRQWSTSLSARLPKSGSGAPQATIP